MQDRLRELANGTFQCIVCATIVTETTREGGPAPCPSCAAVEQLDTVRTAPFSPDELHPE